MYELLNERHNPPVIQDQKEQNTFQNEIRNVYGNLLEALSPFGEEGDLYGVSDFAVRPDLRDRATVRPPPAPHVRQFNITCLTKEFYIGGFLQSLHQMISTAALQYRVLIDQDFDPKWSLMIILTYDLARVNCTDSGERSRLIDLFANL